MPNESANKNWTVMLHKFADFIRTLKLSNGNLIPMIMRPFHESLGSWFWWGHSYVELINNARMVVEASQKVNKIAAIGEFGVRKGTYNTNISSWWMSAFYEPLFADDIAWKIAYTNTWADTSNTQY